MDDAGQGLELALLAAPLPGDAPAGEDLRQDFSPQSLYYRLRDARAEARELERRADHDPDAESGTPLQWRTVRELAVQAITQRTKDLEIAAWLTEALVRSNGVSGLAAGARLITELAETLWDQGLHPLPDEDGVATRVAPITGLNGQGGDGTLLQPLRKQVLFAQPDGTPVSYWQYTQSEELESITDKARRKQRLDARVVPLEDLEKAARVAGGTHFAALRTEVTAALAAWTAMGERLDERAGADAPPTSRVREVLEALLAIARRYAPAEVEPEAAEAVAGEAAQQTGAGDAAPGHGPASPAKTASREDMLKELGRIADYFRRTEPHSPLAYTLEEAVRRGRLTWPELLEEVVPDSGVRSAILVMLGIRPPTPPAD